MAKKKKSYGRNDLCPCGSGEKYKNCCMGKSIATDENPVSRNGLYIFLGLILIGGAAIWYGSGGGPAPDPWEYDAANDRYWHPGHEHWHDGPPPQQGGGQQPGQAGQQPQNQAGRQPGGETPEPYEYDEENDQYWHPEHGHWHQGRPPQGADAQQPENLQQKQPEQQIQEQLEQQQVQQQEFPEGEEPDPWEYDEENDRHWHAGHGHWHQGPPPEDAEEGPDEQPDPELEFEMQ